MKGCERHLFKGWHVDQVWTALPDQGPQDGVGSDLQHDHPGRQLFATLPKQDAIAVPMDLPDGPRASCLACNVQTHGCKHKRSTNEYNLTAVHGHILPPPSLPLPLSCAPHPGYARACSSSGESYNTDTGQRRAQKASKQES